jgi:hypothetical protein
MVQYFGVGTKKSKQNGSAHKLGTPCSGRVTLMVWFHLEHVGRSSPPRSAENGTFLIYYTPKNNTPSTNTLDNNL